MSEAISEVQSLAQRLVAELAEAWARDRDYNLNVLRRRPAAQAILKAEAEVQIAVARRILDIVGEYAAQGGMEDESRWYSRPRFPWGCVYLASSILKRKLSCTTADFEHMFAILVSVGRISASQFEFIGA